MLKEWNSRVQSKDRGCSHEEGGGEGEDVITNEEVLLIFFLFFFFVIRVTLLCDIIILKIS